MIERVLPAGHVAAERIPSGRLCWCLAGWFVLGLTATAAAQRPPARVTVAVVRQRELPGGQTFVGTVVPLRTSTVGSQVEGKVVEFLVNEGDHVIQDQPLAKLRTEQLDLQLAAAEAEFKVRQEEEKELVKVLPLQILEAEARKLAAEALLKLAESRWKRAVPLFEKKAISEEDLDDRESVREAARRKVDETELAWRALKVSHGEKLAQAKARFDAQDAEVKRLEDAIKLHTIRAPFAGYVTKELTEKGQWLAKGDPVVEVVEVDPIDVEVPVLESYVSQLRAGTKSQRGTEAQVEIGAAPGTTWPAEVVVIVPQADVRSRSFPVKVRLKNPSGPGGLLFKPGMFARVTLPVGKKGKVLLVPKDAVVLGGRSPVVYAVAPIPKDAASEDASAGGVKPDGVARRVPVELGAAHEDLIEVRGPLEPEEDRVVVEGNERLSPGQPLIIVNKDKRQLKTPAAAPSK